MRTYTQGPAVSGVARKPASLYRRHSICSGPPPRLPDSLTRVGVIFRPIAGAASNKPRQKAAGLRGPAIEIQRAPRQYARRRSPNEILDSSPPTASNHARVPDKAGAFSLRLAGLAAGSASGLFRAAPLMRAAADINARKIRYDNKLGAGYLIQFAQTVSTE